MRVHVYTDWCAFIREHLPCFLRQTLSLSWHLPTRLVWVASEPWGLPGVHFPTPWITHTHTHTLPDFFLTQWILEYEFGLSDLQGKLFTN